jgi:ssDNA-binding Zn-finger/Zn-ribbon topoisomerase 1
MSVLLENEVPQIKSSSPEQKKQVLYQRNVISIVLISYKAFNYAFCISALKQSHRSRFFTFSSDECSERPGCNIQSNVGRLAADDDLLNWMSEVGAKQCPKCGAAVTKLNLAKQSNQYAECHKMLCRCAAKVIILDHTYVRIDFYVAHVFKKLVRTVKQKHTYAEFHNMRNSVAIL